MFAWIKTPKGMRELQAGESLDCTSGADTLFSCDKAGSLVVCNDKTPAKIEHKGLRGSCSGGGTLSTCDGTLHICD